MPAFVLRDVTRARRHPVVSAGRSRSGAAYPIDCGGPRGAPAAPVAGRQEGGEQGDGGGDHHRDAGGERRQPRPGRIGRGKVRAAGRRGRNRRAGVSSSGSTAETAAAGLTTPQPKPGSGMAAAGWSAVARSRARTCAALRFGRYARTSAAVPATNGTA